MRALEGFFSACFHQDWDLDGDTPESLIELYLQSEAPQTIRQAADELESLLAGSSNDLNVILEQRLGCYYSPLQQGRPHESGWGAFTRGADGSMLTNEASGHFWQNWTPEIREQFLDFMKNKGLPMTHREGQ